MFWPIASLAKALRLISVKDGVDDNLLSFFAFIYLKVKWFFVAGLGVLVTF